MTWTPLDERWLVVNDERLTHRVLFTGSPMAACGRKVKREPVEDKLGDYPRCTECEALFIGAED